MSVIKKIRPGEFQAEVLDHEGPVAVVYWNPHDPNHAHYATQLTMQSEAAPGVKVVTVDVSSLFVQRWAMYEQNVTVIPALYIYKTADEKSGTPRAKPAQVTGSRFVPALRVMFKHALNP